LESFVSGQGRLADSCEDGNETSRSVKGCKCFDQFHKKDPVDRGRDDPIYEDTSELELIYWEAHVTGAAPATTARIKAETDVAVSLALVCVFVWGGGDFLSVQFMYRHT
jgi:hypothetical protein